MLSSRHRPCVSVNESAGLAVHHISSRRHRQNNANAMHFIQIERERERENNGLAAFVFCSWFVIRVSWSIEFVSCYYSCCCCGCRRAHTAVSMHFLQNNSRARALLPWTGARAMRKCFDCRVVCGVHEYASHLYNVYAYSIHSTLWSIGISCGKKLYQLQNVARIKKKKMCAKEMACLGSCWPTLELSSLIWCSTLSTSHSFIYWLFSVSSVLIDRRFEYVLQFSVMICDIIGPIIFVLLIHCIYLEWRLDWFLCGSERWYDFCS